MSCISVWLESYLACKTTVKFIYDESKGDEQNATIMMNRNVKIKSCDWEMRMAVGGKGPNNSLQADKSILYSTIFYILYKSARCWFCSGDLCFWPCF